MTGRTKVPLTTICTIFLLLLICIGESRGTLSCYKCGQYNDGVGSITPCINSTAQMHLQECPTSSKWCIIVGKLTFGDYLTKVELPESAMLPYCIYMKYAGWCQDSARNCHRNLQTTDANIISSEECDLWHTEEQFCAVDLHDDSTIAEGDSGSPLVYQNVLYGIVSSGSPKVSSFVLTKVFSHLDFINQVLKNSTISV